MAIFLNHLELVLEARGNGWKDTDAYIEYKIKYLQKTTSSWIYLKKQGEREVAYEPIVKK